MGHLTALPDLFPGFQTHLIDCDDCGIHCRTGGEGPPLLLLHGYPQSHVMWHKLAPELAKHFTLVIPDLPGYGQSSIPPLSEDHAAYSKRRMAEIFVTLMANLGHESFQLVGHDRGGRVSYRMALDHPDRIERISVIDILPTYDYWHRMDRTFALKIYHWAFLAQAAPFPETMISASPAKFLDHTLQSWTAHQSLECFDPGALAHYHAAFQQAERIAATCEDYRAGAYVDVDIDTADATANNRILAPLLAIWGATGIAQASETPIDVWSRWADDVSGGPVDGGHFLPEENPEGVLKVLLPFLKHHHNTEPA
ncbi:alpha/beta fold hydrolase [Roseibium algae]|uniref:Alpha/beta hydrolase n=1 Tax=Roseibium algae TaxID=3123038 RepID=A0ABU8THB0_9HYPH